MGNEAEMKNDILVLCDLVECLVDEYIFDPKDENTTDAREFIEKMREKYGN